MSKRLFERLVSIMLAFVMTMSIYFTTVAAAGVSLPPENTNHVIIGTFYFTSLPSTSMLMEAAKTIEPGMHNAYYRSRQRGGTGSDRFQIVWYDVLSDDTSVLLTPEQVTELKSSITNLNGGSAPVITKPGGIEVEGEATIGKYESPTWIIQSHEDDEGTLTLDGWTIEFLVGDYVADQVTKDANVITVAANANPFVAAAKVIRDSDKASAYIGIEKEKEEEDTTIDQVSISSPSFDVISSADTLSLAAIVTGGATDKSVTWSIENPSSTDATMVDNVLTPGTQTGLVTIKATANADETKSDTVTIRIADADYFKQEIEYAITLIHLELNEDEDMTFALITPNEGFRFDSVTVKGEDASYVDGSWRITFDKHLTTATLTSVDIVAE